MGGRPQKREKASGRKGWELGSTWNVKWVYVGIGFSGYVGTGHGSRVTGFTLERVYVGTLVGVYVGRVGRGYGWTRLR